MRLIDSAKNDIKVEVYGLQTQKGIYVCSGPITQYAILYICSTVGQSLAAISIQTLYSVVYVYQLWPSIYTYQYISMDPAMVHIIILLVKNWLL